MPIPLTERTKPLIYEIFVLSNQLPIRYQFSIGEQLRRASLSIGLNIAESNGRKSAKEKINFLNISLGSIKETTYIIEMIEYMKIEKITINPKIIDELDQLAKILYVIIRDGATRTK